MSRLAYRWLAVIVVLLVGGTRRLTCGRHPSQAPFAQVSLKREDLTNSDQHQCCW
jgi:hypothetical protein